MNGQDMKGVEEEAAGTIEVSNSLVSGFKVELVWISKEQSFVSWKKKILRQAGLVRGTSLGNDRIQVVVVVNERIPLQ